MPNPDQTSIVPTRSPAIPAASVPLTTAVALALGSLAAWLLTRLTSTCTRFGRRLRDERGQATTEYALVLLAAALVALLVIAWATAGGGAARISELFNRVIDAVIDRV